MFVEGLVGSANVFVGEANSILLTFSSGIEIISCSESSVALAVLFEDSGSETSIGVPKEISPLLSSISLVFNLVLLFLHPDLHALTALNTVSQPPQRRGSLLTALCASHQLSWRVHLCMKTRRSIPYHCQ
ncbi:hypothetical protein Bca52824_067438 [Brassica carinata]|uniref:Uncharacterized protein n=1 Tax=Brassica carinata TaxID=52824 RepID=A0A8X7QSE4_BRACI|nr:hypothetical protein Bca52824_067438 [Brassica carinata]